MYINKVVCLTVLTGAVLLGCSLLGFGPHENSENADLVAPGEVTEATCVAGNQFIDLNWIEPTDSDFFGVEITCINEGVPPELVTAGTTSVRFGGLDNGTEYSFLLQTKDVSGNTSAGVAVSNIPFDTTSQIRLRAKFDTSSLQSPSSDMGIRSTVEDYSVVIIYDPQINAYSTFMEQLMTYPSFSFIDYEVVPIAADGAFSHEIEKGKTFACFLVDNTQSIRKTVGIIGVGTDDESTWELISADIVEGDVYLGTIPMDTVTSVLVVGASIDDLNLSEEDVNIVQHLAQFDDTIRFFENFINNNFQYITVPAFWSPAYSAAGSLAMGEWLDPANVSYDGYGIVICTTVNIGDVQFFPPAEVTTMDGGTYDPSNPYSDFLGAPAWVQDYFANNFFWSDSTRLRAPTQSGYWQVRDTSGELQAELRIDASGIEDATNVLAPMPVIRLNANGEQGYVTDVDIKWVMYNGVDYDDLTAEIISAARFGTVEVNLGTIDNQEIFEVPFEAAINIELSTPYLNDVDIGVGVQYMYNACYFGFPY